MTKTWGLIAVCAALVSAGPGFAAAEAAPAAAPAPAADNLMLVNSTQLRRVFVAPGADFRRFHKILLDPPEVAFAENWVRDFNRSQHTGGRRLNDRDAERIKSDVSQGMADAFTRAFRDAGYTIVSAPGHDVLRVQSKVANLAITAPDLQSAGRSRTFAQTAGEATLILEARDSASNALLGRALDRRIAGDSRAALRNSVTNRADLQRVARLWAQASVQDLAALKAVSPVRPGTHPNPR